MDRIGREQLAVMDSRRDAPPNTATVLTRVEAEAKSRYLHKLDIWPLECLSKLMSNNESMLA